MRATGRSEYTVRAIMAGAAPMPWIPASFSAGNRTVRADRMGMRIPKRARLGSVWSVLRVKNVGVRSDVSEDPQGDAD